MKTLRTLLAGLVLPLSGLLLPAQGAAASSQYADEPTWWVDSAAGSDANTGRSPSQALRSVGELNRRPVADGDWVVLERNGTYAGDLALDPSVRISAYPQGTRHPILTGCLSLTGGSSLIQDIELSSECRSSALQLRGAGSRVENATISSTILNDGSTQLRSGIDVFANDVRLEDVEVRGFEAGVRVRKGASSASVIRSRLVDNNVMNVNDDVYDNDYGAYGILLEGRGAEVAWNTIAGSRAPSHDYGYDGSAVEIYDSSDNFVHHNVMVGNDAGSELGVGVDADNQPGVTDNNTLGMNLIVSAYGAQTNEACAAAGTCSNPAGIVLRGAQPGAHGPTTNTYVEHNTIHLPGTQTTALSCTGGCGDGVLSAVNNILSATTSFVTTGPALEQANLFDGQVYRPGGADGAGTIRGVAQFTSANPAQPTAAGYIPLPGSPGEHTYVGADGVVRHGIRLDTYSSRGDLAGKAYPSDENQINLGALQ